MAAGKQSRRKRRPAGLKTDGDLGLKVINARAAGIDIGNSEHYVAVPPALSPQEPVRCFGSFTAELQRLVAWLLECGIETVAMQATGVYWIALQEMLERAGIQTCVINAATAKNLPGRKSDVQECQWLLKLHVYGLLKNSFRPADEICVLRALWRQRQQHIADAGTAVQRMQKALTQMNIQLANVISDITGKTGMAILKSILGGERDPQVLSGHRDPNIKASRRDIALHLEGNWRQEHLFVLRQQVSQFEFLHQQIRECDEVIEQHFQTLPPKADKALLPPPEKRSTGNVPHSFDLRAALYAASGVDLTRIDGINVLVAQTLIAEVGLDMNRWKTEAHFASWLGLCPDNRSSGGRVLKRGTRHIASRAATALRQAASTLLRSKTYLGAQFRRFRMKLGSPKAITAMAHKLARLVYRMLKYGEEYVDRGTEFFEERIRQQRLKALYRTATELGLQVVESSAPQ